MGQIEHKQTTNWADRYYIGWTWCDWDKHNMEWLCGFTIDEKQIYRPKIQKKDELDTDDLKHKKETNK